MHACTKRGRLPNHGRVPIQKSKDHPSVDQNEHQMIKQITNEHIRDLYWGGFLEAIFASMVMNAPNLMNDPQIEPLVFSREVEDKHFQLTALRKKFWE